MYVYRFVYFLVPLLVSLVFISCGDSESDNSTVVSSNQSQYLSISRAPDSEFVSIFQNISLEFSAELNASSVNNSTAYITDSLGSVFGSEVEVDELNSSKITFTPHKYFSPSSNYTIVITTGIQDIIGRSLSENFYHLFSTEAQDVEIATLSIKSTKPTNNKSDIDPTSDFYIEFNRFISQENVVDNAILELRNSAGDLIDGVAKVFNSTMSFIPSSDLNTTQNYTLTLMNSVSDMFGNIYDVDENISSWNFITTDSNNIYNKVGISRISEHDIEKSSYMITTLKNTTDYSLVAVGSITGIELYKINYIIPFTKPSIELLYSHQLPSKVNALTAFNDNYIVAGTKENGVYSFSVGESNLTEVSHFPLDESIYGIALGADAEGTLDRAYAVGPEHGLSIYALYEDATLETISHVDENNSIMIDVLDATGYDEAAQGMKRRIYVADYNDAMLVYDENGVLETKVNLNASIRKILPLGDYNGVIGVAALSSTGIVKAFDLDATANPNGDIELPLKVSNAKSHIDNINLTSKSFISDKNRGLVLLDSYPYLYPDAVILYSDGVISSSVVSDTTHNINYVVGVSENGKLGVYNIATETTTPQVLSTSPDNNETIEANASIVVTIQDETLDFVTLNSSSFELIDLNTSQTIVLDINVSGVYDTAICTLTPQTALEDKEYKLTIKNSISDIVGNLLNGGSDVEVVFSAQTDPIIIPEISINDITVYENNTTADFLVSMSGTSEHNVTVSFATSNVEALAGSDYVSSSDTITIEAGLTSKIISIPLVNDYILESDETFNISLSNPSMNVTMLDGTGTATILSDVGQDVTTLSLSGDANVSEGSETVYTISLSQPAATNLDIDVNLTHISTISGDISSLQSYYTIVAGSTSTTITLSAVDDNISNGIDIYSINLAGTSYGGNFESLNINTTPIETSIIDNDISSLSINDVMVDENESVITFTVSMDKIADEDVTFEYFTADTNTTAGSDYTSLNAIATIQAGANSIDINTTILNDSASEGVEIFTLNLQNVSSNAIIADGVGIGSIYDEAIVMVDDNITGVEDMNVTGNVFDNDIGDGLSIVSFNVWGGEVSLSAGETFSYQDDVNTTLNTDGSYLIVATNDYIGELPSINYITTESTNANITINIANDNNDAYPDSIGPDINATFNAFDDNGFGADESNINEIVSATFSTNIGQATDISLVIGTTYTYDTEGIVYITVESNGSINVDNRAWDGMVWITYITNTDSNATATVDSSFVGGDLELPPPVN